MQTLEQELDELREGSSLPWLLRFAVLLVSVASIVVLWAWTVGQIPTVYRWLISALHDNRLLCFVFVYIIIGIPSVGWEEYVRGKKRRVLIEAWKVIKTNSPVKMIAESAGLLLEGYGRYVKIGFVVDLRGKQDQQPVKIHAYFVPTKSVRELFEANPEYRYREDNPRQIGKQVECYFNPVTQQPVALKWDDKLLYLSNELHEMTRFPGASK